MRTRRQILLLGTDDPGTWQTLFLPFGVPTLRWNLDRNFFVFFDDEDWLQNILTREYIPPPQVVKQLTIPLGIMTSKVTRKRPTSAVWMYPSPAFATRSPWGNYDTRVMPVTDEKKYLIKGKSANQWEYVFYQALMELGYRSEDVQFQVGFDGGRNFKGGFVVDFLLNTKPAPTPVWINGDWWHSGARTAEDIRQQSRLWEISGGQFRAAVTAIGENLVSVDSAKWFILEKVGLP